MTMKSQQQLSLYCLLVLLLVDSLSAVARNTAITASSAAFVPVVPYQRSKWNHRRRILLVSTASTTTSSSSSIINTKIPETTPLPPHTFGGMVECRMIEKFGGSTDIQRVLESWRLMDMGYVHKEYVGTDEKDPETSLCHQLAPSYVPGLRTGIEFWDTEQYEWCSRLKSKYRIIRDEFMSVISDPEQLQKQGNNIWTGALTDDASSYGVGWKTLVLMNRGMWDETNANLFPKTAKAVFDSGAPTTEVFFASMQPNSDIKQHSDFTNFVLTSHLALYIPENGQNKCRLKIGDTEIQWMNGQLYLFDTSIMHEAINETDETRYILMLRLWHPDLTDIERQALQFTFDALEFPNLVSDNIDERKQAQQDAEMARTFPDIISKGQGGAVKTGFGTGGSNARLSSSKKTGFGGGNASSSKNSSKKKKKKGRK